MNHKGTIMLESEGSILKLIYGTTNKAKIDFMKRRVEPLGIEILSLTDVYAPKLGIIENGNSSKAASIIMMLKEISASI